MRQYAMGPVEALLVSLALTPLMMPAHAQDAVNSQNDEKAKNAPLVVTIRPSYKELKDGYVEDAIIETADGHFMLFTGQYMRDPGPRFSLPGSDRVDLSGMLFDLDEIAFGESQPTMNRRRYGLARDFVGMQLGRRYQDMSFDEISLSYGRDPYKDVKYFGSRGFYTGRNLWEPYDLADQVLGDINFSTASGAPPPLRLSELVRKALELLPEGD